MPQILRALDRDSRWVPGLGLCDGSWAIGVLRGCPLVEAAQDRAKAQRISGLLSSSSLGPGISRVLQGFPWVIYGLIYGPGYWYRHRV